MGCIYRYSPLVFAPSLGGCLNEVPRPMSTSLLEVLLVEESLILLEKICQTRFDGEHHTR